MSSESTPKPDPFRADAVIVYRYLVAHPDATVIDMANILFPVPDEGPVTTQNYLRKRSVRRVLDSLVWMRHQGVHIWASPAAVSLTTFRVLAEGESPPTIDPNALRKAVVVTDFVTDNLSQSGEDVLGGELMGMYHQGE